MIIQVTGLPRSGTAFIATFLNLHPYCICHHDLAADRDDWKEYPETLEKDWQFVGEVSTYGWLPKAQRPSVLSPKVAIFRRPEDSHAAVKRIMGHQTGGLDPFIHGYEALKDWAYRVSALRVSFEDLHTVAGLQEIWNHVFVPSWDTPFPVEKAQQMITMNVQRRNPQETFGDTRRIQQRLL